jgi:hypothetical protein
MSKRRVVLKDLPLPELRARVRALTTEVLGIANEVRALLDKAVSLSGTVEGLKVAMEYDVFWVHSDGLKGNCLATLSDLDLIEQHPDAIEDEDVHRKGLIAIHRNFSACRTSFGRTLKCIKGWPELLGLSVLRE